jgi:hypothetical protein
VSADDIDQHKFENDMAENAGPAVEQAFTCFFGQDSVERVKKPCLL